MGAWNAIITGYEQCGLVENASTSFKKMHLIGIEPNLVTFASISNMGLLKMPR